MANENHDRPVVIGGRVFWNVGGRLIPGVGGASGDPPKPGPSEQPPAGDAPAPKFMTAEDFNGAMTARERRFEERMAKQLAAQFEKFWSSKSTPPADPGDESGHETDPTAIEQPASKKPSGAELAAKKAAAKVDALMKQMAAKEEAAAKEKAELLQRQEKSEMLAALASAGVTTAKGAYATLKEDGRIRRNADGELVMVVVKEYGEDEVPVSEGIRHWLGTDDGKCFLPPRGGGDGSGTVVRGGAPRNGAPLSKEEAKREAQRMLTGFILGGGNK